MTLTTQSTDLVEVGLGPVTIQDVVDVARRGHGVRLTDDALAEIARSRARIEDLAARTRRDPVPRWSARSSVR